MGTQQARKGTRRACCRTACATCCCHAWSFAKRSAICCWMVSRPPAEADCCGRRVTMGGGAAGSHASAAAEFAPALSASGRIASLREVPTRGEAVPAEAAEAASSFTCLRELCF